MSLTFTKAHVKRVAAVLDQEFETAEEAAEAVLAEAFEIYEERAKFTVVGQLIYRVGDGPLHPDDKRADKFSLGAYATETQANNAAASVRFNNSIEEFRAWVLPIHHGTPAALFKQRKEERDEARLASRSRAERIVLERIQWHRDNPDQPSSASEHIAAPDFT